MASKRKRKPGSVYCKGIYAGCSIIANARCASCERIRLGKSTVEKEMQRKLKEEKSQWQV